MPKQLTKTLGDFNVSTDILRQGFASLAGNKPELNDLGIAVVLSHIENGQGSNKVISVSPDVGTEYVQEGTNSVVTLYYD